MSAALVWLRRDLRLHDHPVLASALGSHDPVAAVFCLDRSLIRGRHESGARTQFLLECLADLDTLLRERGSRLIVRQGAAERELCLLARELRAGRGLELELVPDRYLAEPWRMPDQVQGRRAA
jgi:deoxyribodipyrimidine photo-lyase